LTHKQVAGRKGGRKRVAEHIDHKKLLVAKTAGLSGPYVRNLSGQRCALGVDAIGFDVSFLLAAAAGVSLLCVFM
jgi:hypothetical protein